MTDSAAIAISDMTPEELRTPLMDAMMEHIAFDGWSLAALNNAASDIGVTPEMAELAFPRGAIEVLEMHLEHADAMLAEALADMDLMSMKIRDRITTAIRVRLEQNTRHREAISRGLSLLALPQNLALASRSLWATADVMWRAAGDTSTDHNWYTKRLTLSGVYSSVLLYWLSDESDDYADTWTFLDRRIEDVMKIEKAKWEFRKGRAGMPSLSRFLGRIRYPMI